MRVKRILGLLLALALVFSLMMPAAAFANDDGGEVPQGEKTNELLPEDPGQGNDDGNDNPPLEDEGEPEPTRNNPPPAAPRASVTTLNPQTATFETSVQGVTITRMLDAEYLFSFAQEPSQEQMDAYGRWYCDFFVSVSDSIPADSVGFWGQYGSWQAFGFTNPYEVPGNSPLPLVRTSLADAPGIDVSTLTLNDIVYSVVTFDCGVANLSAANCGKTLTVDLRIWNPENENESYSLGETTYTFASAPEADVTEVASPKTNIDFSGTTADLEAEYVFSFKQNEPSQPQLNLFGDWNCDYIVSFDKAVAAGTIGLYGQYDNAGSMSFKNPDAVAANEEVELVRTVIQNQESLCFNDINRFVHSFDCGVVNLDPANCGTKMTVELRLWKGDTKISCGKVEYTFAEAPEAVVTPVDSPKTGISFSGTTADLEAEYVFTFKDGEPTGPQLSLFGDWYCDYFVSFDKAVAAGAVGFYGQYGTREMSFANPDAVDANTPVPLVRTLLVGQTGIDNLNLNDIANMVRVFDCGVVGLDPSVAGTKMTVELRIWKGGTEISCGSVDYTFAAPPEAVVTPVDPPKTGVDFGGTTADLEAEYVFSFKDGEPTAAQLNMFGDWYCDYFVSFDDSIAAGTVGLYGQYGGREMAFSNPAAVAAGAESALVKEVVGSILGTTSYWTLSDVALNVPSFDCGVVNLDPANCGKKMTVELRIWKDGFDPITLAEVKYTFPTVEAPLANVDPVDPLKSVTIDSKDYTLEAEYLFTFKDGEPTAAQLNMFGDWYCDYFVSFDDSIAAGTVGLYGQYGGREMAFSNPAAVAAGAESALVKEVVGSILGTTSYWTLSDVALNVPSFDCGVVNLDPANAGKTMTVELRIWKGDTTYTLATQSFTFPAVEPPVAVVTEKPEPTSIPIDGTDTALQAEYVFTFQDGEPTPAQLNMFGSWYCDYFVSFSDEIAAESIAMYGQYDSYGPMSFKNPDAVTAGDEVPMVKEVVGTILSQPSYWTLSEVNELVGTFDCGVVNLSNDNTGKKMTVELRIWNPDDDTQAYTLAKVEYTFLDPDAPPFPNAKITELPETEEVEITEGANAGMHKLEAEYVFEFEEVEQDLHEAQIDYYGDWYCDYIVSFDHDVAADTVGVYGAYTMKWGGNETPLAYAFMNPQDIAAGQQITLVRALADAAGMSELGATLNLRDIDSMVGTFTCGVFNLSDDNVGTTMTVELRIWNKDDPTQKHNCGTVDYTFKGKCTVAATGEDANGTLVGNVSGGGDYFTGTEVTLTANPVDNYSFLGWYKDGEQVSASMVYTFTVTEDVTLVALYAPGGSGKLHVYGKDFVLGGNTYTGSPQDFPFDLGTSVTVESTQPNFAYWTNISGNIVSTSKTYSFVMVSDTTLYEIYSADVEQPVLQAQLYFLNSFNQVIGSAHVGEDDISDSFPARNPSKMGGTFDKWIIKETGEEATEANIIAQMKSDELVVLHIVPSYTASGDTYTLKAYLEDENGIHEHSPVEKTAALGQMIVVTKQEVADENGVSSRSIKLWKLRDGTIVGYGDSFSILSAAPGEYEVIAFHTGENIQPEPVIFIAQQYAGMNGVKYRVSTTMHFTLPEGYTLRESGFVYATDSSFANDMSGLLIDAPNTKKHLSSNTSSDVIYTLNLNATDPGKVIYIRAFVTYTDPDSGENVTLYTDPVANSYNSLL